MASPREPLIAIRRNSGLSISGQPLACSFLHFGANQYRLKPLLLQALSGEERKAGLEEQQLGRPFCGTPQTIRSYRDYFPDGTSCMERPA